MFVRLFRSVKVKSCIFFQVANGSINSLIVLQAMKLQFRGQFAINSCQPKNKNKKSLVPRSQNRIDLNCHQFLSILFLRYFALTFFFKECFHSIVVIDSRF